jgi:hypothetical protein
MAHRRLFVAGAVASASIAVGVAAALVVDQSAPTAPLPVGFTWAVGGLSEQVLSQSVTAGIDGRLREVRIPIGCASGEVVMEIRDVNAAGEPGGTVLYSESYRLALFDPIVTDEFTSLRVLGPPVRFTAGDRFAILLSNPTGSCGVWPGPVGDPYAGGKGWSDANDGPLVPLLGSRGTDDLPFITIMQAH